MDIINLPNLLVNQGVLVDSDVPKFMQIQQTSEEPFSQVCVSQGIDAEKIVEAVASSTSLPWIKEMSEVIFSQKYLDEIGKNRCYSESIIPIEYFGMRAIILFQIDNEELVSELQNVYLCEQICLATPNFIGDCISKFIIPLLTTEHSEGIGTTDLRQSVSINMDTDFDNNKTIKTIGLILGEASKQRASDVLIVSKGEIADVKFRIDGVYREYSTIASSALGAIVNVFSDRSGLSARAVNSLRTGKIELEYKKKGVKSQVRFNFIPTKLGGSLNIRFLSDAQIVNYQDLGMSKKMQAQMKLLENISQGLILIVGPTGSGKSTTMLAYISELIKQNINICTVEDPVEAVIEGVNQVDISDSGSNNADSKTNLTFGNVLRSFMRHDPDVIMVGEIRDLDVARTALQAADTGHLVISTIHTKDAVSSISRLLGLGVKPFEICDSLVAVVAQRLVRRVCSNCKEAYMLEEASPYRNLFNLGDRKITVYRGKGCPKCNGTGYHGRIVISECLILNNELKEAIELHKPTSELYKIVENRGFTTLVQDGVNKALEGLTTLEELHEFAQDHKLGDLNDGN